MCICVRIHRYFENMLEISRNRKMIHDCVPVHVCFVEVSICRPEPLKKMKHITNLYAWAFSFRPKMVKGPPIHLKDCIPKLCKPWQQTTEWFVFGLRLKDHHQPWHDKLQFHPEFRHWDPWKHAACCWFWYESSPLFGTQWIDTHDTQLQCWTHSLISISSRCAH